MRYAVTLTALALAVLVSGSALCAESITIGVLDVKRVIQESKYSADYEAKIQDFYKKKQAELNEVGKQIEDQVEVIRTNMRLLSDEAKEAEGRKIAALAQELRDARDAAEKEVREERAGYAKRLEEMMQQAVEAVATEQNIQMVLNSMAVLYKTDVRDITDLVIAKLDKGFDEEHGVSERETEPATESVTKGGE
jgi:outer membrane protein